jgi:aminopeptidase N/puromycin-sensitive aminopeptidase
VFFANASDAGYFRTAYTPSQLSSLVATAENSLTATERIGLLGDRWALMRAGQGSVGDYLNLALAFKKDSDATVVETALGKVHAIDATIASDEDRTRLAAIVRSQFGPVYQSLGTPSKSDTYDRQELRAALFGALGAAKDPAVLAEARKLTDASFTDRKSGDPILTDTAIVIAATNGDAALYEKILALSKDERDPVLQADSLNTLPRFRDPALVARTLDYAVSGQVRNQSSWIILSILLSQRETREQAWSYIQSNWDKVHAQFTASSGSRIVSAAGSFCSVQRRDEVSSFFATHKVDGAERTLSKAIDSINACVQLRAAQEPPLNQWLGQQN